MLELPLVLGKVLLGRSGSFLQFFLETLLDLLAFLDFKPEQARKCCPVDLVCILGCGRGRPGWQVILDHGFLLVIALPVADETLPSLFNLLLLDDVLSAVDHGTESTLIESLHAAGEHRDVPPTIFIVSHRISALRNADSIVVLEDGHVVDQGVHDELIDRPGVYQDVWEVQKS